MILYLLACTSPATIQAASAVDNPWATLTVVGVCACAAYAIGKVFGYLAVWFEDLARWRRAMLEEFVAPTGRRG